MIVTEVDGIVFLFNELENNELELYSAKSTREISQIKVPDEIDGRSVVQLHSLLGRSLPYCETFIIPDSVKRIPYGAFSGNKSIQKLVWPENCRIVPKKCFACSEIKEIILPEGIEEIGEGAFCDCPNLSKINLPDSIRSIGARAFESCRSLYDIRWPAGANRVQRKCFYDSVITHVSNAEHINYVDKKAFAGTSIRDLNQFPNIFEIGDLAFWASKLKGCIQIPRKCRYIGNNAFTDQSVNKVVLYSSELTMAERCFPIEAEIDAQKVETLRIADTKADLLKITTGFETIVEILRRDDK